MPEIDYESDPLYWKNLAMALEEALRVAIQTIEKFEEQNAKLGGTLRMPKVPQDA
jgi:hypothetical protein